MGSSKKQTVGYQYWLGMHQILVHGPVDRMTRYTVDGRTAWSGSSTGGSIVVNAPSLFGGEAREGGVSGTMDLEMGGPAQGVNSYLSSKLGELVPAFRGVVGIVMRQMYLGNNPYLKKNAFRLQRIHVRQDGIEQWYDEKAEVNTAVASLSGPWLYKAIPYHANPGYENLDPPEDWDGEHSLPATNTMWPYPTPAGWPTPGLSILWVKKTVYNVPAGLQVLLGADNGCVMFVNGEFVGASNRDNVPIGSNQNNPVTFTIPATGTYEIVMKAFTEDSTATQSGNALSLSLAAIPAGGDMNPAHIIRECLTDPIWGMGYLEEDMDDVSFMAAADQLHDEGMGMSLIWDRQMPIEQFIGEIVKHINAALYVGRSGDVAGKFVLKLIRADYDEETLPLFDESNIEKFENYKRVEFGELTNSVTVNYWDSQTGKTASTTAQDPALVQQQGAVINTTMQYPGFTNHDIADRVALRDLLSLSTPLASGTIYTGQDAKDLNIGDVIAVSWEDYGLVRLPMRITAMSLGDGQSNKIKLTLTQDVFGMPNFGTIVPPSIGWENTTQDPIAVTRQYAEEMPYYELVQQFTQSLVDAQLASLPDMGMVGAACARPQSGAINARLITDSDGSGYEDVGSMDFSPSALLGADVGMPDGLTATETWALNDITDVDAVEIGSYAKVGNEYVIIVAIDDVSVEVKRAALDTVPEMHDADSVIFFSDPYIQVDPNEYVASDEVDVKMLTVTGQGTLSEAAATPITTILNSRAIRPFPPGNFTVNDEYYPENVITTVPIVLKWAHRDRVQETGGALIGFLDGDVGPEPGVTYTVRVIGYDTDDVATVFITEDVGTLTEYSADLIANPPPAGTVGIGLEVYSVRDGYESLFKQSHFFSVLSTPYGLSAVYTA